jgi:hypothetical protein
MCVLIFCITVTTILLILRISQRDIIINVKTSLCKVPLFLLNINEFKLFRQIYEKSSNITFYQNLFSGSRVV